MSRNFAAELARAHERLQDDSREATAVLRDIEEAWARQLLGLGAGGDLAAVMRDRSRKGIGMPLGLEAAKHLESAEMWQVLIASQSSGSGEGIAAMTKVHRLQMARAWVLAALAHETNSPAEAQRARALADVVAGASNGLGRPYRKAIADLRTRLAKMALAPSQRRPRT